MKINYLILENFSNIETAMNTHKIKIDFTRASNRVILLVGRNGCGKTSILSMLTPFANVGGLDVRNSTYPIISGRDGYKEIQIQNGSDIYTIKHFYTSKSNGSHSVKSYIEKNGTELNVNGNVSSFREWVKMELHVEPDYLKLIRLGANVSSMISMTESERKAFMNKLLEEADAFLALHKKVKSDLSQVKLLIGHATDKKRRLGVTDIDQVKDEEKSAIEQLSALIEKSDRLSKILHITEHTLSQLGDISNLQSESKRINAEFRRLEKVRAKKSYVFSTPDEYLSAISTLEASIAANNAIIENGKVSLANALSRLDSLSSRYHELEVEREKENDTDNEIQRIEDEMERIYKQIAQIEISLPDTKPNIEKDELERFIVFLKSINDRLSTTYEFGKRVMGKLIFLRRKEANVQAYVDSKLATLSSTSKTDKVLTRLNREYFSSCKFECDKTDCPAYQVYIQLSNLMAVSDGYIDDDEMDDVALNALAASNHNIVQILSEFSTYSTIINRLPSSIQKDFILSEIYNRLEKCSSIYNEAKINALLATVTEYEVLDGLRAKIHDLEQARDVCLQKAPSTLISSQMEFIHDELAEAEDEISSIRKANNDASEAIAEAMRSLVVYQEEYDALTKYSQVCSEKEDIDDKLRRAEDARLTFADTAKALSKVNNSIAMTRSQIQSLSETRRLFKEYQKEIKKLGKIFDDLTVLADSLSSTKGIPLLFIKNYLGNIEEIANEMLSIAFGDKIYLDKFRITQSEFAIPFINRGKRLSDVKYASQGELAFISIALSFALSSQTLREYNILLLDEIDSALDNKYKEKFLGILEAQMERMNTEQCFFITHGDMFSSYPVDVIALTDDQKESETIPIITYDD